MQYSCTDLSGLYICHAVVCEDFGFWLALQHHGIILLVRGQSLKDRNQVLDRFQEAVTRMETFHAESIQDHQRPSQNQNFDNFDHHHDYSRDRNYPSGGFRSSNTPDRQYYTSGACADDNGPGAPAYAEPSRTYSAHPLMSTPYPGKPGPLPYPGYSRIPADSRRNPEYNFPSRAPTPRHVGYPEPYSSNRFYDNPDFSRSDRAEQAPTRKLATYDGTTSWDSFIFQFDRMANSFRWPEEERINHLMECLREEALEHFTFIPDASSYNTIKLKMRQLFQVELTPTTARINARELRQQENESEEAFSKRVIKMVRIGYRDEGEATWNRMAIDTFIQGCSNSEAKTVVLNADPKGFPEAIRLMKQAVAADSIACTGLDINFLRHLPCHEVFTCPS